MVLQADLAELPWKAEEEAWARTGLQGIQPDCLEQEPSHGPSCLKLPQGVGSEIHIL